jgi:hypothetical protein
MRLRTLALPVVLLGVAAVALSSCLAASVAGTAVGVTAKTASAAVHAGGAVAGAVIP